MRVNQPSFMQTCFFSHSFSVQRNDFTLSCETETIQCDSCNFVDSAVIFLHPCQTERLNKTQSEAERRVPFYSAAADLSPARSLNPAAGIPAAGTIRHGGAWLQETAQVGLLLSFVPPGCRGGWSSCQQAHPHTYRLHTWRHGFQE